MAGANQKYLIYLDSYRIYFYSADTGQIVPIDLPSNIIRDLEVLSRDQLITLIETFITTNNITAGNAVMVLAQNLLFEKQLAVDAADEPKKTAALKEYAENVPFEKVAYVSYPLQAGIGVISTNEELFMTIKRAFAKKDIETTAVVPIRAYGDVQINPQTGPDAQTAAYFLQNADQTKSYAFHVVEPVIVPHTQAEKKKANDKQASKRMPIYLSIFGFLLLVLVFVVIISRQPPQKPTNTNVNAEAPPAAAAVQPPVNETPSQGSASATLDKSKLKVLIKAPVSLTKKADDLKTKMTGAGYASVDVAEGQSGTSTVVFLDKTTLTTAQQDALTTDLKTYLPQFTVQTVDKASYDVQIVGGSTL